ncbi:MAG: hypothetical protein H6822_02125 [Planctomycetaceae bacterium]|nr:hypothetical protein [Planctomycetales bacterium]MCB9920947.1 hypothetical protein [Planctomycetaceae bacterium]
MNHIRHSPSGTLAQHDRSGGHKRRLLKGLAGITILSILAELRNRYDRYGVESEHLNR